MKIHTDIGTRLRNAALLALCLPALAGCFGAAAVGVGTGALLITDRRNSETYVTDQGLELRAGTRISERHGDKVHVNVTSYNRMLLLTGEAPNAQVKADIEKLAAGVPNVRAITNELAIAGPSSFGARSNDTYITSKVKARFVDAGKFSPNHVKVVTEGSVVFLLGLVTQVEANDAVEIARTTGGVQKVVRVFETISPEQAKALDNKPEPRDARAEPKK
ncbi:BON domain-containing protein [Sulfuritalea sp.]|uniref:BON domain-containing protein n=1 Tax=Sulfuritalea sp. TaxID=2480090 RepID=UPI001ACCDD8E|nr:BON domain-containing protein [Sulfuritalea sp.]MBN8475029.1 BON domain-containing protein [Sulfuritalea sp.]